MRSSIRQRRVILLRSDIRLATSDMPTWSALRGAMGEGRWNNKLMFIGEDACLRRVAFLEKKLRKKLSLFGVLLG